MNELDYYIEYLIKNNKDSIAIFDFDYTLTYSESESSIGVFTKYLPKEYRTKKQIIDKFSNIINNKFFMMIIWKYKLNLLSKYYNKQILEKINYNKDFILNKNVLKMMKKLSDNNVETLIYSSGIKDIITNVLKSNKVMFNKSKIFANDIDVDSKKINKNIITPKNKRIKHNNYKYVILFGDKKEDLNIIKKSLKILVKDDDCIIIDRW